MTRVDSSVGESAKPLSMEAYLMAFQDCLFWHERPLGEMLLGGSVLAGHELLDPSSQSLMQVCQ